MNRVLVIGGDHQNPLGIARALGLKGLKSDIIVMSNKKSSFILSSKFWDRKWICPSNESVILTIKENFSSFKDKTVCIACCDNAASLLSNHYDDLKDILLMPGIGKNNLLSKWMNKQVMVEAAGKLGLTVPKSWVIQIGETLPADILYPCVAKPITSVNFGKNGFKLLENKEQLESFLLSNCECKEFQIQQFIEKDFEFQYIGLSLNGGETIIIPGRTHILATPHFNNLTFLKYQKDKIIKDTTTLSLAESFVKQTGYSGLFSIEFMHGKDGKDYFLEMNFRNDGNGIVVTASGTNLPYLWYLHCIGKSISKELKESYVTESYCLPEESYYLSMLLGDISYRQWQQDVKKATCYITKWKGDDRPYYNLLWHHKRSIIICHIRFIIRLLGLSNFFFNKR